MDVHVLNGDALAGKFPIAGQKIIIRECLIDGPVKSDSLTGFWKQRAHFIADQYSAPEEEYFRGVRSEFEKLLDLDETASINLWFEHDLFCQVNMWFVVHYLAVNRIDNPVFRVMPSPLMTDIWSGFGRMQESALSECYDHRLRFRQDDVMLANNLWIAYSNDDLEKLAQLSNVSSPCFPLLEDAVQAHIQRYPLESGRPQKRLKEILDSGKKDFDSIFSEFAETEGVYGFGDTQVKDMLEKLN